MEDNLTRVPSDELKTFSVEVFSKAGVPRRDAETESEVLIWANLRGVDSHGVLRIPLYLGWIDKGIMKPKPNIRVVNETPATFLIDADSALGPVVTTMAMNKVIEKAKNTGIGWGLIRNTTHQGAMAYYSLMAAEQNMAGLASVCSPANMAPHGARVPGVHNSPIAIAVPGQKYKPISLDMATSVAAGGKLEFAKDKGVSIPNTWALDDNGQPTTDPKQYKSLLPFGGPKGSGLAVMFECLSSLMVGNPLLQPPAPDKSKIVRGKQNSFVAAINISTFTNIDSYRENVDRLVQGIKSLPKTEGTEEIFVPGEIENRVYEDRSENGIPLPAGTVQNLRQASERFSVPLPKGL
jgi:LDH2 family malate/lactate/ureidoglycolate dehydrogenase